MAIIKIENMKYLLILFNVRRFHFFHSYDFVGGKFIGAYFPDFMDKDGLQTFVVCQNAKCNKCGKETQYKYEIKGDHNLTQEIVEKNYCA
jgi:hypothetical protein